MTQPHDPITDYISKNPQLKIKEKNVAHPSLPVESLNRVFYIEVAHSEELNSRRSLI